MHELSLALEVCRQVEAVMEREGAVAMRRLAIEIGADAGVEVENFRFCLETLLGAPPFGGGSADLIPVGGADLRLAWVEVDDGHSDH